MYYHGADPELRRAIEVAEIERAKMIASIWARLFSRSAARQAKNAAQA